MDVSQVWDKENHKDYYHILLSFRLKFLLSRVDISSNAVTAINDLCLLPEMSCVDCRGKHDVTPAVRTLASHVWKISISATAMSDLIRILKVRTKR